MNNTIYGKILCWGSYKIYIPESVKMIENEAFKYYHEDLIIYAPVNSYGYNYAKRYKIAVVEWKRRTYNQDCYYEVIIN